MLKPTKDYIAVRRETPEHTTSTGIMLVLPVDASQEPAVGEVIAVGPGRRNKRGELVPVSVKPGDRVLIGHYAGDTVKVGGDDIVLIKDDEILGVIE